MLSPLSTRLAPLAGLITLGFNAAAGAAHRPEESSPPHDTRILDPTCIANVTVYDTTTIIAPTTLPVTHYVDVTKTHYVNVTVSSTETCYVTEKLTESTTTTLHYTVNITETSTETDFTTITNTETDLATIINTETDLATITNTETDLTTITNTETDSTTVTSYTTTTIFSTSYDPCPTTCSISVETVNLYFWPTNRPYSYPTTYYDEVRDYTFTSPSVYMFIPTARGTNTLGQPEGPSTSSWMLALDLDEVSTIDGSVTSQLHLSDLGTDCPKTADPTAIATMVDPHCDPILAAPKQVSSWAYPCNACGRFGLFDPPYAVPTVTGGLVPTTTATPAPVSTTVAPAPTSQPVGVILIVYYSNGTPVATATVTATGISGTQTSSVIVEATTTPVSTGVESTTVESTVESTPTPSSEAPTSLSPTTTTPVVTFSSSSSAVPTSVVTAAAPRATSGLAWLISSIFIALYHM